MRMRIRVGLLLFGFIVFMLSSVSLAQNRESSRPEGWQGPWPGDWQGPKPGPQGGSTPPGSQRSTPSGKQVMEIPPRSQPPLSPPRQQADIPPRPQPEDLQSTQFLTATVTDQQGRYVPGLQPEDFEVYEDDEPQKITYFNTGEKEPFSMGILIDTSGSMQTKIDRARFALRRLIDAIRPRDEVFIEAFNSRPYLLQDFTDSRLLLTRAVSSLRPMGGTALYDAILEGLLHVKQGRHPKKTLFIISDGEDENSYNSLGHVIEAARRTGVLIYAIGISGGGFGFGGPGLQIGPFTLGGGGGGRFGGERGDRILREATEQTGGSLFSMKEGDILSNEPVLDDAMAAIAKELRSQYTLGYRPRRSGSQYRKVRVEARRARGEQLEVRTQKGYATDTEDQFARERRER